jgi:hypothetical protein
MTEHIEQDHENDHLLVRKGLPILVIMTGAALLLLIISLYNKRLIDVMKPQQLITQEINLKKDLALSLNEPEKVPANFINPNLHIILLKNRIEEIQKEESVIYNITTIEKSEDQGLWTCEGIATSHDIDTPIIFKVAIMNSKIAAIKEITYTQKEPKS